MDTERKPSQSEMSSSERFFIYFRQEITALQEKMVRLENTALVGGERKDATDHCLASITRLGSEVKDASSNLPAHDIRTYSEAIKALQDKLAETQATFAPKQKFAFKTRKNASAISLHDAAELAAQKQKHLSGFASPMSDSVHGSSFANTPAHMVTPPNEQLSIESVPLPPPPTGVDGPSFPLVSSLQQSSNILSLSNLNKLPTSTAISNHNSSHIVVPAVTQHAHAPCQLDNLSSCYVDLSAPATEESSFASLTIRTVDSSLLLCSSISGPSHVTGVRNSIIVIKCRQFRMHECHNVDVYLYCTSRPIIEDCTGIRFAEMPSAYATLLNISSSSTQQSPNQWNQIDDFKWLKAEQSPNWSTLPAEKQLSESTWKDVLSSKAERDAEEVLTVAELRKLEI